MCPLHPAPSNSEKWRLIGIPCKKSNTVVVLVTVTGRGTSQVIVMLITHHLVAEYLGILSYIPWKAAWFISWSRISFLKHRHLSSYCFVYNLTIFPSIGKIDFNEDVSLDNKNASRYPSPVSFICNIIGFAARQGGSHIAWPCGKVAEWSFSTCLPCDTIEYITGLWNGI